MRIPLGIEEGVTICEIESVEGVSEVEIVVVIIRGQDEIDLVLTGLPVDRAVAVNESVNMPLSHHVQ